ncbi:MAG: T9SS type A sorting domain-containing protein [Minisyncoccia bacterium]
MNRAIFAALVVVFAASQALLAGIRIELPPAVAVSGTGATIATDFVGSDEVVVTVRPSNQTEVAHYGIIIGFNPDEYRFVETKGASVFWAENGRVSAASSYILNGPNVEDMSIVLRRLGSEWGRLEPQGLDVFTKNRERRVYDPAPVFTPNPAAAEPKEFGLAQNYPNPFNPSTEIRFSVANEGVTELAIYNMIGQRVRTLVSGPLAAGEHTAPWDATDDAGQPVSNGMYLYHLNSGGQTAVRKMILAK